MKWFMLLAITHNPHAEPLMLGEWFGKTSCERAITWYKENGITSQMACMPRRIK